MSPKKCSAVLFCIFDLFSPLARSLARPCVARPPAPVGEALRRRSWFLSRVELSMSFALDFPTLPPSLPPSVRPRSDRDRGTAWSRPRPARALGALVDAGQRSAGAERRREAVIRVAAKSKFKSNPYPHLSPCRRQNPPCFHIRVRGFNHVLGNGDRVVDL